MITEKNQNATTKNLLRVKIQTSRQMLRDFNAMLSYREISKLALANYIEDEGVHLNDREATGRLMDSWKIVEDFEEIENYIEEVFENIKESNVSSDLGEIFSNLPLEYKVIKVQDDAMSPTIKKDGYVIVDTDQTSLCEAIHAISINGVVSVRRIQFRLDGGITLLNDNPLYKDKGELKFYPPHDIRVIGKVILTIQ